MSEFARYVFFYAILLGSGGIILRYLVPRNYLQHGRLSPPITFLQALLFFAYGGFPTLYLERDWPAVAVNPLMRGAGLLLVFSGLTILFYGMGRLGVIRSMGRGSPHLEQSGLYAVSRNPQAVACGLYVVGFYLLWPSWYAVGWACLYVVLIHMMVLAEEEHLSRLHGLQYQAYRETVPRYLGFKSFFQYPCA